MALFLLWSSRLQRCLWTSPILAVLFSSYPGLAATSFLAHTQKAGVGRDLLTRYMRLCVRSGSTLHTYKMTEWGGTWPNRAYWKFASCDYSGNPQDLYSVE